MVAAWLTLAPVGVTVQTLRKAHTVVQFTLVAFASASVTHRRLRLQLRCLVFATGHCLRPHVVLALQANALLRITGRSSLKADAIFFLASARARAVEMLRRRVGKLNWASLLEWRQVLCFLRRDLDWFDRFDDWLHRLRHRWSDSSFCFLGRRCFFIWIFDSFIIGFTFRFRSSERPLLPWHLFNLLALHFNFFLLCWVEVF